MAPGQPSRLRTGRSVALFRLGSLDRPGAQRHRHRAGGGDQAQARQLLRPAGEKGPKGAEEATQAEEERRAVRIEPASENHGTRQCCHGC